MVYKSDSTSFYMAITWNPETGEIKPAIVNLEFDTDITMMDIKFSNYLKDNIDELEQDCD